MVNYQTYKQKAVLWAFQSYDQTGEPVVSDAEELKRVRWEYIQMTITGVDSKPKAVDARVWVTQEIALDSIMWKGELRDLPDTPTALFVVVAYEEIPDTRNRTRERTVLLQRYRGSLPTIA